jgi:hypothetical protein
MARRGPRLPVGGRDAIVVWQSAVAWIVMYLALIALFVLAIVVSYQNQASTSGKIGVIVFFGLFIALFVFGLVRALRRRCRLEISAERILYVDAMDNTLVLDRESGDRLRIFGAGQSGRLSNGDFQVKVPLSRFSRNQLRSACAAKRWEFPAANPEPDAS